MASPASLLSAVADPAARAIFSSLLDTQTQDRETIATQCENILYLSSQIDELETRLAASAHQLATAKRLVSASQYAHIPDATRRRQLSYQEIYNGQNVDELRERTEELQGEVDEIREKTEEMEGEVEELRGEVEEAKSEVEDLTGAVEEVKTMFEETQQTVEEFEVTVDDVKSELDNLHARMDDVDGLERRTKHVEKGVEDNTERCRENRRAIADIDTRLSLLAQEFRRYKASQNIPNSNDQDRGVKSHPDFANGTLSKKRSRIE